MPASLGYWKTRGLAQPIRLLLNYVGEEFNDVMYELGDGPEFSREEWTSVKDSLGLPFPNIPYYIDGDVKITQSNAIIRYIGRKHKLLGKTEQEKIAVDILLEQAMDFRNGIIHLCYYSDYEKTKDGYFKELPQKLNGFQKFLGNNPFFSGKEVTVVDFVLYELLDQHRLMKEGSLNGHPKLVEFLDRFEALPSIKTYMSSDKFMQTPVNNKSSAFI